MITTGIWKVMPALLLGAVLLGAGIATAPPPALAAPAEIPAAQPCTNAARFVADLTIPDNTILQPGQPFRKTWRLRNSGSCTWSASYRLMRGSGAAMGGPAYTRLGRTVRSNETIDISVQLVAPTNPGTYRSSWQMADASNRRFGPEFSVQIVVPDATRGEELPDTLTFMGGAGGGTTKDNCAFDARSAAGQQVTTTSTWFGEHGTQLCIFGLPRHSMATVTLRNPAGARYSAQFDVGGPVAAVAGAFDPATVLGIPLMWPAAAPQGDWQLSVQGEGLNRNSRIVVTTGERGGLELRTSPLDSYNPFDTLDDGPFGYALSYPVGERIQFSGSGYPADTRVMVGVYQEDAWGDGILAHGEMVTTNRSGRFTVVYRIPETSTTGRYWVAGWLPGEWEESPDGGEQLRHARKQFYVRSGPESPTPSFRVMTSQPENEPLRVVLQGINLGRSATRGASLTLSSPDAGNMWVEAADAPIIQPTRSNCDLSTPHAWVLGPGTPCNRALQYGTDCKQTVALTSLMAEGWYKPWATGETQTLIVRLQPLPGRSTVRLYARMAMLEGVRGCRIQISPQAGETGATDQQGFPAYELIVPAP